MGEQKRERIGTRILKYRRCAHAHVALSDWMGLTVAGLVYTVVPACADSKLARTHFWGQNLGLPAMSCLQVTFGRTRRKGRNANLPHSGISKAMAPSSAQRVRFRRQSTGGRARNH